MGSFWRDVASGIDRHPDGTERLQIQGKAHPLFPYFLDKCLAISTSPFSFTSNKYRYHHQLIQIGFLGVN